MTHKDTHLFESCCFFPFAPLDPDLLILLICPVALFFTLWSLGFNEVDGLIVSLWIPFSSILLLILAQCLMLMLILIKVLVLVLILTLVPPRPLLFQLIRHPPCIPIPIINSIRIHSLPSFESLTFIFSPLFLPIPPS